MSMAIEWKPFYSVGDAAIDSQHKQILAAISELCTALDRGNEQKVLKPLLDRLVQYTEDHFRAEEKAMEQSGYPDLAEHATEHAQLRKRTVDLRAYIHLITARDLLGFLKNWWLGHIQGQDKQYAPYLQAAVRI
jgi:hemerythrin